MRRVSGDCLAPPESRARKGLLVSGARQGQLGPRDRSGLRDCPAKRAYVAHRAFRAYRVSVELRGLRGLKASRGLRVRQVR